MPTKLYVGNLSFQTSSEDLQKLFSEAGTVESASAVEDRDTGRPRGFGFVEMATREDASATITEGGTIKIEPVVVRMELPPNTFADDLAEKAAARALVHIALSRKRAQKTQTEINRLKKKTEAILDKLK